MANMDILKMFFPVEDGGIFLCYVSLPECSQNPVPEFFFCDGT